MKYLIDANVFAKKAFDIAYPIVAGHNDHERGLTLSGIAQLLDEMQPVDAIPIEWIEKHISEIEDDVPNVAGAFKGLIVIWRAEQEKANETD